VGERPSWDEYFLGIAEAVSRRSDCERDQVGAVVVGQDHRIRSTGFNGSPAGMAGCSSCPRRTSNVAPGSCYSNCLAVHAELNALLYCDRSDLPGSTLYITRKACYGCLKAINAAGVSRVVTPENWCELTGEFHCPQPMTKPASRCELCVGCLP
jgi:dCMP deaminase